jgi:hypothetical protein
VSRARQSPEQSAVLRREVLRQINVIRYLIRDIVANDIDEAPPRPDFTPTERDTHKRVAVGTRRIVAVRERIREVRRMNARPTSVRHATSAKFPSVRSSYIKGDGNASVLNGMRSEIYRQFAEHQKRG